ncbi:MAG: ComF family protein [Sphingobacteriia bacterium]|nr:ComF family protein [Sphingobacteriia bacterium]
MKIKIIWHYFLDLFYPNLCCVCNESLMTGEQVVCLKCINDIPRTNFHKQPNNIIEKRFWGKVSIERATAFYFFQKGSKYQKILHLLKYKNGKEIGYIFGKYAASELIEVEDFQHFDYLVPVPLHPSKLQKRGYNQSEQIALGLSEILKSPIETQNLYRAIANPTQTKKSVYERWENTDGIFKIHDTNTFAGKHILLIDDVLTTGATLIACANAILQSQNAKVSIFTLAVA